MSDRSPAMTRRTFLAAAPATFCAAGLASAAPAMAPDTPFLAPIAGMPDMLALCFPKTRIDYAYRYMLNDGRTILAERDMWSDGSPDGWRKIEPGQFDGRVIGRIESLYIKGRTGWEKSGSGYLAG